MNEDEKARSEDTWKERAKIGERKKERRKEERERKGKEEEEDDGGLSSACHCSQPRQKAVCIIMGCHLISHERGKEVAVYVRARARGVGSYRSAVFSSNCVLSSPSRSALPAIEHPRLLLPFFLSFFLSFFFPNSPITRSIHHPRDGCGRRTLRAKPTKFRIFKKG